MEKTLLNQLQAIQEAERRAYEAGYKSGLEKGREESKWICSECGEVRKDDARVEAGMKCSHCSYNSN
jgi:rubrerythrin